MMICGVPAGSVIWGVAGLAAFSVIYDNFVVDWLETHKPYIPAQTAFEVVGGVLAVLVIYLLAVQDRSISGINSFCLLLIFFAPAGLPMINGSKRRTEKQCVGVKR
jgi:hypothetical protein